MRLLTSPFSSAFRDFIDSLDAECTICSPYITSGPVKQLVESIQRRRLQDSLVIQVITDISIGNLLRRSRSKYGMGLKAAASWIGNCWTIRTKKLGETTEHFAEIDVQTTAQGNGEINYSRKESQPEEQHYTVVEISKHNQKFQGRTLGKIKDFLGSMCRVDLRSNTLTLEWQGVSLSWEDPDMIEARDGTPYKKDFDFTVDGKRVHGWIGILAKGSRASAGFSIIHAGRVVRGWPDSWRPSSLYGQLQGSNDLVNQRLVGEIHLDDFDVSHTKDDILCG